MSGAILILGATSAIARGAAAAWAQRGYRLYLAGRDVESLRRDAADLTIRYGVAVHFGAFDAAAHDSHAAFLQRVTEEMGELEGVLLAFGYLGSQARAAADFRETLIIINRNFVDAVSILNLCADQLEQRGRGFIAGIASVAGDRGRQSNYTYGAAKGAFALYLQGLRNRLFPAGVRVLTIKPGFVDTAMTFGMPGLFLVAAPQDVGARIVTAVERGRDVIYVPWFWRYIMLIITCIPERLFKRLKL
ncbi:SDR family oxidoreductase [Sulfurivermis fontis]|uniref:SDR family oxidoreductase n=1 Tax=Sulfurivermis fontis TaxID=1972068 RepID=UPI000FD7DA72|nr:SDR family oxidoreductase [Sulfurivermis fontis]